MSVATLANLTVVIQRKTNTLDATGSPVQDWVDHLRLRARVQPLSGAERLKYSREQEMIDGKAYFPGTPDITNRDRMKFSGKFALIMAVRNTDEADVFTTVEYQDQTDVLT